LRIKPISKRPRNSRQSVDERIEAADDEVTRIKQWLQGKEAERDAAERDAAEKEGRIRFEMKLHQLKLDANANPVPAIKNVDSHLKMTSHVNNVSKSAFFALRNVGNW
jgi:hypothetical protein